MNYSINRDEKLFNEMVEHYGVGNIPNPEQYPIRFEFLTQSFEHFKKIQSISMSNKND